MPTTSLNAALNWLASNAATGNAYTITLQNDETIAPRSLDYSGKTVDITITGGTTERFVSLSTTDSLFTVENGVTLTLDNNVTLQGRNNTASLVRVNSGGTLVMNTGSKISDNTSSSGSYGGGVYVSGGTFTMSGGTISGNTSSSGSGSYGGGVYVSGGTFTMSGGTISDNTSSFSGSGVYVSSGGTFSMRGGTISGNTSGIGGGVYVSSGGIFTKQSGGVIYGSNADSAVKNTATRGDSYGHAVYINGNKKRDTTADTNVTLNSSISGSAGGWE
jgi:hypothetical protein